MEGAALLGAQALINICISLISIVFCWWILTGIRIEAMIKTKRNTHAKALMIVLSIVLGHNLASFLIDYLGWSRMLSHLFV